MHRVNDRLLQTFIHLPAQRSGLIFDLDSTVVTVFGNQENAAVGYNPRYRGKKSCDPLLCIESNSSFLWDAELRPGNAGTWDGSLDVLDTSFANVPPQIRELRVRADAGFGFHPVFAALEARSAQYAVTARLTPAFKRLLPGVAYAAVNRKWEMAEFEHRLHGWPQPRRFVVSAKIHSKGGSRDYSVFHGPLHLSCLGHQHVLNASRDLAFLRRTCRDGTADSRTP